MGDATWGDAASFVGVVVIVLWIALAMAIGAWALAAIWVTSRAVSRRLERRYLPDLARWSRRRAGLTADAGPWACPACSSVNASTIVTCYGCGVARPAEAPELRDAATDPGVFHLPEPASQFDPSRYRGLGALVPEPPPAPPEPLPPDPPPAPLGAPPLEPPPPAAPAPSEPPPGEMPSS